MRYAIYALWKASTIAKCCRVPDTGFQSIAPPSLTSNFRELPIPDTPLHLKTYDFSKPKRSYLCRFSPKRVTSQVPAGLRITRAKRELRYMKYLIDLSLLAECGCLFLAVTSALITPHGEDPPVLMISSSQCLRRCLGWRRCRCGGLRRRLGWRCCRRWCFG